MTHQPPVPAASQSPYPLHPEPVGPDQDFAAADDAPSSNRLPGKIAIGIGSAAIVAALLFSGRRSG